MSKYIRTSIIDFVELPTKSQLEFTEYHEGDQFVQDPCDEDSYLPLDHFWRHTGKLWDGVYGTSYFSAYFIKYGDFGQVTVAYRHF